MSSITFKNDAGALVDYGAYRQEGNRATYIGANHSDTSKDMVVVTSSPPKRTANSHGNRRSTINIVRSVTVATPDGGTEVKDAKIEWVISLPVGISASDANELKARAKSVQDDDFEDIAIIGQTQLP